MGGSLQLGMCEHFLLLPTVKGHLTLLFSRKKEISTRTKGICVCRMGRAREGVQIAEGGITNKEPSNEFCLDRELGLFWAGFQHFSDKGKMKKKEDRKANVW